MQRLAAAVGCLLVATAMWAQTPVASNAGASDAAVVSQVPEAPSAMVTSITPEKPKLLDRSLNLWMAASFAATVADVESTAHGMSACGLVERNPLLGRSPSRPKMYAIGLPATAAYNLFGLWVKRKAPGSRVWMWIPGAMTAVHTGAAAHNFALCH